MTFGKRPSLFWTIAGAFLLTIVVGTLAQWLVAVAVLEPLETSEAKARAETVSSGVATEIATGPSTAAEIAAILARHRADLGRRPAWLVYRARDGALIADPPWRARRIAELLGGPVPAPQPAGNRAAGPEPRYRYETLARHAVSRGGETLGEVLVMRLARPPGGARIFGSPTPLLFLPIAVIASVAAGLVIVRVLVRRLRALETLAARVADGDLSVRIQDRSGDEIGRLAERLDWMTGRLAEARDRLEEIGRQRRQLFADITHELATPLTSIRGNAETLLDPGVPLSAEERARYLRGLLEEARRLDRLISDLFELSRLEAGASPLALETIDWAALCRNTIERFLPRFREAGLEIIWLGAPPEAMIDADGHRMEQVIENLLTNALRYVPTGGHVEVGLERAGEEDRAALRLAVRDDGPGVPAEELPRIFERFYRAPGARPAIGSRFDGGSGLGLAIVREIVERHGGSVRALARSPRGLAIELTLPARTQSRPAPGQARRAA